NRRRHLPSAFNGFPCRGEGRPRYRPAYLACVLSLLLWGLPRWVRVRCDGRAAMGTRPRGPQPVRPSGAPLRPRRYESANTDDRGMGSPRAQAVPRRDRWPLSLRRRQVHPDRTGRMGLVVGAGGGLAEGMGGRKHVEPAVLERIQTRSALVGASAF